MFFSFEILSFTAFFEVASAADWVAMIVSNPIVAIVLLLSNH
jgi:hypothetical protein